MHFPIAFLMLGFGLDFLHQAGDRVPAALATHLPPAADLTRASYWLILLGLVSAVPAVLTGALENIKLISKQGLYEADGKTIRTKVKAAIAHAVIIDLALAATGYAWYARYQQATQTLAGKLGLNAALPYAAESWVVGTEVAALGFLAFGSNIGGALTYNYGVGFSSASASTSAGKKKQ